MTGPRVTRQPREVLRTLTSVLREHEGCDPEHCSMWESREFKELLAEGEASVAQADAEEGDDSDAPVVLG